MKMENTQSPLASNDLLDRAVDDKTTPRPWSLDIEEYDREPDGTVIAGMITIREIERCLHDIDWAESADWERDLANAELIVMAVNTRGELLRALLKAKETIRALHGIEFKGEAEEGLWTLYQHSPEMKQINAALESAGAFDAKVAV